MPRYYFDTLDGEAIIDDEGETAADHASARDIAIRIVSEMTPVGFPLPSGGTRLRCPAG